MALPLIVPEQTQPERQLRLVIVDTSREYMAVLRRMLAAGMPEVEVTEYDAEQKGRPGAEFDWAAYDAILLAANLDADEEGLDWLRQMKQRCRRLPPVVLMAAEGNEYLAARAIKLGAADYIRKQDITTERIAQMIADAVEIESTQEQLDSTLKEERKSPHLAILERLAQRVENRDAHQASGEGYRFVRLIGQGASSRVYLAERMSDDTSLVLKVIDAETVQDIQVVERFIREAEIVATLSSPYVVKFFDYGLTQTYGYIAMEFFTRGDLKQRLERGVAVDDAINYLRHIAFGLDAIHAKGIIHRDLKPGNIMFRADDSLALADFGISRQIDRTSDLTNVGCVLGTPNYLSPEQALGHAADHRADIYSAGVVLYEMLAGRKPFRAESAAGLVYQHVHAAIPALPAPVARYQPLLTRLLAKDPDTRFQTAAELVTAIDEIQGAPGA